VSEGQKVYATSAGDYSDYHIVAVYSTKEAAQQLLTWATESKSRSTCLTTSSPFPTGFRCGELRWAAMGRR